MSSLPTHESDDPNLQVAVARNRYGAYCVPRSSRDRPAARSILAGNVHEPNTIEFLRSHCGAGDIVHAGAYFGDFLPALSQGVAADARVWAFEPNRENYRCAQKTLLLNGLVNVELLNAGLGERRNVLRLLTTDPSGVARGGASTIISGTSHPMGHTELVPIVTIDDTLPLDRYVSIIQLDVEGHEQEALAGGLKTIARCRPVILVEVLAESRLLLSDWFSTNILGAGYRGAGSIDGNEVFFPT